MPTVTAADEALSRCSQNAAYSPTIMAAQIRSAKAQAESGNPAMVTGRRTLCTTVMATCGFACEARSTSTIGRCPEQGARERLVQSTRDCVHLLIGKLAECCRWLVILEDAMPGLVLVQHHADRS